MEKTFVEDACEGTELKKVSLASLIDDGAYLPLLYEGKAVGGRMAVTILLSDDPLLSQRFCTDNPELCDSQDLWKALFHIKFPELYPLFLEVSIASITGEKRGVTIGRGTRSRRPLFWRDCYSDLQNMPYSMSRHIEALINGDIVLAPNGASFWGAHAYLEKTLADLFESFWTVGVVLANLDATRDIVAPALLMIPEGCKLMPYVLFPHEIFSHETLFVIFQTLELKEDALLYLIENEFSLSPEILLSCAARNGYIDIFLFLLDPPSPIPWSRMWGSFGAYVNQGNCRHHKALRLQEAVVLASAGGHSEVLRFLLDNTRVDPSANNNEALLSASKSGHSEIVQLLLSHPRYTPPGDNYDGAMRRAIGFGHSQVVQILLGKGCSVRFSDARFSSFAWPEVLAVLLGRVVEDGGVDPAAEDNRAVWSASRLGYTDAVRLLLADPRVDPASRDNRAILAAANEGHRDVVQLLLADPRVDAAAGSNAAIWAAVKASTRLHSSEVKNKYEDVIVLLAEVPVLDSQEDYERLPLSIIKKIVRRREGHLASIDPRLGKLELIARLFASQKAAGAINSVEEVAGVINSVEEATGVINSAEEAAGVINSAEDDKEGPGTSSSPCMTRSLL